jgi:hypothetical protein
MEHRTQIMHSSAASEGHLETGTDVRNGGFRAQ